MKGLLFTYALTYGGAAVSLVNPFYGLLIYICFAIIKPESLWHWSVPAGNYSRIVAIALLFGWAINGFGNWNLGKGRAPLFALVGFWLWAAVCTIFCQNPPVGIRFLENIGKIVLPVVVGASLIENTKQLRQIAWTIVLSQGYVAYDLNMSYLGGFNRLGSYGFGGMDNNSYTIGLVTGVGLAFILGLAETALWKKFLCFLSAAFMAHAVFFSFSRGGMVALCLVIATSFFVLPKRRENYALYACGLVLALLMAGPSVRERFFTSFDEEQRGASADSRLVLWGVCLKMARDYPVFGVGPDHFQIKVVDYPRNVRGHEQTGRPYAHSLWLQTTAEVGVPGAALLIAFYAATVARLASFLRLYQHYHFLDEFIVAIPRMVTASLIGFCVAAQFVSLIGLEIPYYVALLGVGALKINSAYDVAAMDPADEWLDYEYTRPAKARSV